MRYLLLLLLNLPIVALAFLNIFTKYKMKSITKNRFRLQAMMWLIILLVLVASFPVYNLVMGNPLLGSSELSLFDIVQTTVLVHLIYILNNQRQKTDKLEKRLKDIHQDLSIKLSSEKK